jgi:geranylgeranyl diphosphate synthase, type II
MTATTGFLDQLAAYGAVARDAAAAYLHDDGLSRYLRAPAGDYLERGGKGLRPALCLATCAAFGGDTERAVPSSAAIELVHTAMLVHDDVEDDSELRRGSLTLHRRYGRPLAINAGDGLAVIALGALRDNQRLLGPALAARVWSEFDVMARQTVDGQARELGWQHEHRTDLDPDDYLDLIMQKTCWYTTLLPLRVGALIGTGGAVDLTAMLRFGFFLGAAFQIRDDVLNLTATGAAYGKEAFGDLREGKRTLMLIHLLAAAGPAERAQVERFLALPPSERSTPAVAEVLELMRSYGSIEFADAFCRGIASAAAESFDDAFREAPDGDARRFVRDVIPYMAERDR